MVNQKFLASLLKQRDLVYKAQSDLLRRLSYLGNGCYDCECVDENGEYPDDDNEFLYIEDYDTITRFCLVCGGFRKY